MPRLVERRPGRIPFAAQASIHLAALEAAQPGFRAGQRRRPGLGVPQPVFERPALPGVAVEAPRGDREPAGEIVALRLRRAQPLGRVPVGAAHKVRQHVHVAIGLGPQILGRGGMGHHRPERPRDVAARYRARPERRQRRLVPRRPGGLDGGAPGPVEPLVQQPGQRARLACVLHEPGMDFVIRGAGLGHDPRLAPGLDQIGEAHAGAEHGAVQAGRQLPQPQALAGRGISAQHAHGPPSPRRPGRARGPGVPVPAFAPSPRPAAGAVSACCAPAPPRAAARRAAWDRCCARSARGRAVASVDAAGGGRPLELDDRPAPGGNPPCRVSNPPLPPVQPLPDGTPRQPLPAPHTRRRNRHREPTRSHPSHPLRSALGNRPPVPAGPILVIMRRISNANHRHS